MIFCRELPCAISVQAGPSYSRKVFVRVREKFRARCCFYLFGIKKYLSRPFRELLTNDPTLTRAHFET